MTKFRKRGSNLLHTITIFFILSLLVGCIGDKGKPLNAPSDLTANPISSSQVSLQWQDNSDNEEGFKIERQTGSTVSYTQIAIVNSDVNTYQDSALDCETDYSYRVRAYNSAGDSDYSNGVTITLDCPPTIPTSPSNLTASVVSFSQVNLFWSDNSDNESGFVIERDSETGGNYSLIYTSSPDITFYSDLDLSADTTYHYRVYAFNSAGFSEYSNVITATTFWQGISVSSGSFHTCALLKSGGVKCWGTTPVNVSGLSSKVTAISVGGNHTCALLSSGWAKCWGQNLYGQLGNGTTNDIYTPVDVSGLSSGVIAISAGAIHTCALLESGSVKCWGQNGAGQLGNWSTYDSYTPVNVSSLFSGVIAISAGGNHTCALLNSGGVKCWGNNDAGQLGDGTTTRRSTPVNVSGLSSGVIAISAGDQHSCALLGSGGVKCWGDNEWGQLGDGTTTSRNTPVDVSGFSSGVTTVSAGGGFTCALLSSGGVQCWGRNTDGQLGDGISGGPELCYLAYFYPCSKTPTNVSGLSSGVTAISSGGAHTCALLNSGGIKCWGGNSYGQLGNGNQNGPESCSGFSCSMTPVGVVGTGAQ